MKNKLKSKGFTLVELMVVIAIIVILTGIISANFATSKSKARDAKRVADLASIQLVLIQAYDRCNKFPPDINAVNTVVCTINGTSYTLSQYTSNIPTDNGTAYTYGVNSKSNPTDYVLKTTLENNNRSALNDSADVDINGGSWYVNGGNSTQGIDCTDGAYNYCVQPR